MSETAVWHDPSHGQIDRDIQDYAAEQHPDDRTLAHILSINLQRYRNAGIHVLGVARAKRVGLIKDLLSSDGQRRPGDENETGLGAALATLDKELKLTVGAALWGAAKERLDAAENAETLAVYIPADEFRERALDAAERIARLWRESCRSRPAPATTEGERDGE